MRTFIPSGIEHILIGPDHILFLIGLLLLGGGWMLNQLVEFTRRLYESAPGLLR